MNMKLKGPLCGAKLEPKRGIRLTEAFMLLNPDVEGTAGGWLAMLPVIAREAGGADIGL